MVFVLVRTRLDFDFKYDLLRKYEMKRRLRSGAEPEALLSLRREAPGGGQLHPGRVPLPALTLPRGAPARAARQAIHAFAKVVTHLDVSPQAEIGRGVYFYHGLGTVIGKGSRIGERALICHGVTTGGRGGAPVIGDDVSLWAGAVVIGRITVGDRVEVGANAVVIKDVPADSVAIGVPARIVSRTTATRTVLR